MIGSMQIEGYGTVYDWWVIKIRRCRSGGPTSEDQIPMTSTILDGVDIEMDFANPTNFHNRIIK